MSYASQMISTHPSPSAAADDPAACIEACFDGAQARTVYAGVCRRCEAACNDLMIAMAA